MTTFSYSSGNPANLTGGHAADMNDIQGPLNDVKTFINSGNLDEAVNVPNLAAAFTTYKTIAWGGGIGGSGSVSGAGTFMLWGGGASTNATVVAASATSANAGAVIAFDPSEWTANARTTKLRLRTKVIVNATAPAATFTVGLYPVSSYGGAAGVTPGVSALGTVTSGSTAVFTTPAGPSNTNGTAEFTAPATGDYVVAFASSGAIAANSVVQFIFQLQMRQT